MRFPKMTTLRWMVVTAIAALVLSGIRLFAELGPILLLAAGPLGAIAWTATIRARRRFAFIRGGAIGGIVAAVLLDAFIVTSAFATSPMKLDGTYVEPQEIAAVVFLNLLLFAISGGVLGLIVEVVAWVATRLMPTGAKPDP